MADIRKLLNQMAAQEAQLRETQFVAPCALGGQIRARVAGLVHTFAPKPRDFEGWGVFRPVSEKVAEVVEEADLPFIARYLDMLQPLRVRLAHVLQGTTWLAYPVNESDARQRCGEARPIAILLVTDGAAFDQVVVRRDGGAWWFEDVDRRADPQIAERLGDALRGLVPPSELRFAGLTPEARAVYELTTQQNPAFAALRARQQAEAARNLDEARRQADARRRRNDGLRSRNEAPGGRDEARLQSALELAGGTLRSHRDRGDYWQVTWTTRDGQQHNSAISKRDLTVVSSGICLSGRDRDFDLQSLVGVMERRSY